MSYISYITHVSHVTCAPPRAVTSHVMHNTTTTTQRVQVYIWGRRHPYLNLSFLGVFSFTANYLPWVLLGFRYGTAHGT